MRFSGEILDIAIELFRPRCEFFGDFLVEENDVLRLKPDVLDVVEKVANGGDPLLVLGLVDDRVLFPPNTLPPLNMPEVPGAPIPPLEALFRCILLILRWHNQISLAYAGGYAGGYQSSF